jgi:dTDP-glucose 4,6-dehydratase
MNVLVTGAAGFIGSNFVRLMLRESSATKIVVLDALTYAGNLSTMADFLPSITFVEGEIQDRALVQSTIEAHGITHIVNFAAESHNDRSLLDSTRFIETNVSGTMVLLDLVTKLGLQKLVHVSTDEVYGTIDEGEFSESSPLEPNTPYSASKAGGDLQCRAYHKAYRTPVCVTRGGNTYGPFQYPEKLISFFTTRLLEGKKVPLYGEGHQTREWIHAEDHARGVKTVLERGETGEIYNIGDTNERRNIEVVTQLLKHTGRGADLVKQIEDPRKGAHDARYSMTTKKLEALGWTPRVDFASGLESTVDWYRENEQWWREIQAKPGYQDFIRAFYGKSLGEDL